MYMTPEEICKEYKMAKNKKAQVVILADQNCCEKEDIINLLADNGIEPPILAAKKPQQKPKEEKAKNTTPREEKPQAAAKAKQEGIPDVVAEALITRLEEIDAQIVKLEKEYREIAAFLSKRTA